MQRRTAVALQHCGRSVVIASIVAMRWSVSVGQRVVAVGIAAGQDFSRHDGAVAWVCGKAADRGSAL